MKISELLEDTGEHHVRPLDHELIRRRAETRVRTRRIRHRSTAVALVILTVAAGAVVAIQSRYRSERVATMSSSDDSTEAATDDQVSDAPPANQGDAGPIGEGSSGADNQTSVGFDNSPLEARGGHSVTWAGDVMLVWGGKRDEQGTTVYADGATYDPQADRWDLVPTGPLAARSEHLAVRAGLDVLIFGGSVRSLTTSEGLPSVEGAAYRPSTGRWRPLAGPPFVVSSIASVARDADSIAVWNTANGRVATYDIGNDEWELLPALDERLESGALVMLENGLTAIGSARCGNLEMWHLGGSAWIHGADLDWGGPADYTACFDTAFNFGPYTQIWAEQTPQGTPTMVIGPDDEVTHDLIPVTKGCDYSPRAVDVGETVVLLDRCGPALTYVPETSEWRPIELPGEILEDTVWTGSELLTWGNACCYGTAGTLPFRNEAWRAPLT